MELKGGDRLTGYLGGYDIAPNTTPALLLEPPVVVETTNVNPAAKRRRSIEYRHHSVVVPGSEVASVWVEVEE